MQLTVIFGFVGLIFISGFIFLFILICRALLKFIKSKDVRQEKSKTRVSLGEALKNTVQIAK